ncbi:MAG: 5-formyltetrahydrofolate cyclo-ligase [Ruminococcaceae bacterium]|nr:5-formyltetrahydrofolate cyclo-ligase [Oscillospiraceae bacterium]
MEDKSFLRKKYKTLRDSLVERAEYSRRICERCGSLAEFLDARTVLLYFPKGSEVDLSSLARIALESGKTVGFPRCVDRENMVFHKVVDLSELESGYYGIMESPASAPLCETRGSIVFVPALSFDSFGYRLGYGGGYYDRFLSEFSGTAVGVTYEACLAESLPREVHDKKTDYIITESQVKRTVES